MTLISSIFHKDALIWESSPGGRATGIGTDTVNIDHRSQTTEQAMSQRFTIGDAPDGSSDGKWDKITIQIDYTHVNYRNGRQHDLGQFSIDLLDENGNRAGKAEISAQGEDGPTGRFRESVTVTFKDVAPGAYTLFVGEKNSGDGEALQVKASYGVAHEDVTEPEPAISSVAKPEPVISITSRMAADTAVPCFVAGTLIRTPKGLVPVENLRSGDLVMTEDHGAQPIRWISSSHVSAEALQNNPKLRPVRIRAGSVRTDKPDRDLYLSRQHRILVTSDKRTADHEFLVPAIMLTCLPGIDTETVYGNGVSYYHFMFDNHEIVRAENLRCESLYLGPQTINMLSDKGREEIRILFPDLDCEDFAIPTARLFVENKRQLQELIMCDRPGQSDHRRSRTFARHLYDSAVSHTS